MQELHANDIMLLAYYIATVNIEMTFHEISEVSEYAPFNGVVFADSFEAREKRITPQLEDYFFETNSSRMKHQQERDIRVIVGNPPWSVGQRNQNDDNRNREYPGLRQRISETYVAASRAQNRRNIYDKYIHAIRLASDRIQESKSGGVVGFVTNGGFIDGDAAAGLRICLMREFHKIYCLNLRGAARGSGEIRRREAGNVFGGGTRTTVTVILMVKRPENVEGQAKLLYFDIGDNLTRDQKLTFLAKNRVSTVDWQDISPDQQGNWINQIDPGFKDLTPLYGELDSVFDLGSTGIVTARDAWVYGFSEAKVATNTQEMMESYNRQVPTSNPVRNPKEFSWTRKALRMAKNGVLLDFDQSNIVPSEYRPFTKQYVYFDRSVNEEVSRQERIFPNSELPNVGIAINAKDKNNLLSCLMLDSLPNFHTLGDTQFLPRWTYEKSLSGDGYERVDNISNDSLVTFRDHLKDETISTEDIFHYVYGILHHQDYRERYAANLSKEAARIPLVDSKEDFRAFVQAGKTLTDLHLNYESVEPYPLEEELEGDPNMLTMYRVTKKMKHPGKRGSEDETALIYNEHITLRGIPEQAHRYVLAQYSALRWLIERYYVKTDSASGIINDPNDWCDEHGDPRYIIDLIKRIVTVSVKTMEIVDTLPELPQ